MVDELIDLLSDDPVRRYRRGISEILESNRRRIVKCTKRLNYPLSKKDKRQIKRIRMRATDKIVEYVQFLDFSDKEKFWEELFKEVDNISVPCG